MISNPLNLITGSIVMRNELPAIIHTSCDDLNLVESRDY